MKRRFGFLALCALLLPAGVLAQANPAVPANQASAAASATPAAKADMAQAEVRRIDREQGKITLRHGPIANLDMPAMTMVFRVTDTTWLDRLKVGDRLRFAAQKQGGVYTVTAIEPMP